MQGIGQQLTSRIAQAVLGKSMLDSLLALKGRVSLKKIGKNRSRIRMLNEVFRESGSDLKRLNDVCLEHIFPVTAPLVLISQIQRSGGSLLSQLFDGHPQLYAHPHELKIGYPKKNFWPQIDLNDVPQRWFEILFEDSVITLFKEGYKKESTSDITFPFIFLPSLQQRIFLKYLESIQSVNHRDVFNAYMTSYFGAWLNNQNIGGSKKFVTAFTPRLSMIKANMETFFKIYPDGRLISIVRNPKNWFPSALRHNAKIKRNKYVDIETALSQWKENTQAAIWNKDNFGECVCIIKFEDLINDIETVMRYLAGFLNIQFDNILLIPTFNKSVIAANTSFGQAKPGIVKSTLSRHQTLSAEELKIIVAMTQDVYEEALAASVKF
jgi:hypothetical protein